MRNLFLDEPTSNDVDAIIAKILNGLGNPEPPINLDEVRGLLKLDRQYYSSTDSGPLREYISKAKIAGKQLVLRPTLIIDVVRKWDLKALYLPDRKRILLDATQPSAKWRWNEAHETIHSVVPWHESVMHGDTIFSLTPACHEQVEAEANYGAGRLLFMQARLDGLVRDSGRKLSFEDVKRFSKYFHNTLTSTMWRVIEATTSPALGIVCQHPHHQSRDFDASQPCRYFIRSRLFEKQFSHLTELDAYHMVRSYSSFRNRGPAGMQEVVITDDRGEEHIFLFEAFSRVFKDSQESEMLVMLTYVKPKPTVVAMQGSASR